MRIANWNLERLRPTQKRAAFVREHMAAVNASIWVLTETHDEVRPDDRFTCVWSGEPDRASAPGERWVAICSLDPIESLNDYLSDPARCAAARVISPEMGEIVLFGCVLPWLGSTWRDLPSADMMAFRAALVVYVADFMNLQRDFPDALFVLAGDFNQSMIDRHYYGSARQQTLLEQLLSEMGLDVVTARDGDPIARTAAPYTCIDHICISRQPSLKVLGTSRWPETARPDKRLSDHFGVAVDFVRG